MKCFYDPSQDAVGTCKSCGKGLSPDYLTDLGKGLACKGHCEEEVSAVIELIESNMISSGASAQIIKKTSIGTYGSGVFLFAMGIIFAMMGMDEPEMDFTLFLGVGFILYGIWTTYRAYKYARIVAQFPDDNRVER